MSQNSSESHFVQIGSKALSNVAGQFSKISQTFTPKIRTGKKLSNNSNLHNAYKPSAAIAIEQGIDHEPDANRKKTDDSSDSDENECSIYEPDNTEELVEQNPIYNENAFIPGVGIVMAQADVDVNVEQKSKPDMRKMSVDAVSMLEKPMPSTAPEIRVQEIDDGKKLAESGGQKLCHSAIEMRIDPSSPIESGYVLSTHRYLSIV